MLVRLVRAAAIKAISNCRFVEKLEKLVTGK